MVSSTLFAGVALLSAALSSAQTIETSSASSVAPSTTISQSMPPVATAGFNPAPVNSTTRFQWCLAQQNTCPQICGGAASQNFCDQTSLSYTCVCPNGTSPDVSAYFNTIPFFICQQTYIQCVQNNPNNAEAQQTCKTNEQCGTKNATAEAIAQTSASAMATASATSSGPASGASGASGSSGSATAAGSASASASASGVASANIQHITTGAFAAILMAACKLFL